MRVWAFFALRKNCRTIVGTAAGRVNRCVPRRRALASAVPRTYTRATTEEKPVRRVVMFRLEKTLVPFAVLLLLLAALSCGLRYADLPVPAHSASDPDRDTRLVRVENVAVDGQEATRILRALEVFVSDTRNASTAALVTISQACRLGPSRSPLSGELSETMRLLEDARLAVDGAVPSHVCLVARQYLRLEHYPDMGVVRVYLATPSHIN